MPESSQYVESSLGASITLNTLKDSSYVGQDVGKDMIIRCLDRLGKVWCNLSPSAEVTPSCSSRDGAKTDRTLKAPT